MQKCTRCLLPETHETITFNDKGVCSVCENQELKTKVNWYEKKSELLEIVKKVRGKYDYDCIIPFSGGKDSTWTLLYAVKELNLRPLVVSFDHGFYRPGLIKNRDKVLKQLGVDFLSFTPNWKLVQKLMLKSFLEKGDFCWHCHTGIFSYPMWVAVEKRIPLILWGEPSSEYTSYYDYSSLELVDEERFNKVVNLGISGEDMLARLDDDYSERDFKPFTYPSKTLLSELGVISVPLGSFIPWDVKKQVSIIQSELGWTGSDVEGVPEGYEYEKIECYLQGVRDYIKYLKRGYSRATHLTSIDIRNKRLTREEAIKIVEENEGFRPATLDIFLDYVGLTEEEFNSIALTHKLFDFESKPIYQIRKRISDFDDLTIHPGMPAREKERILSKWNEEKD